MRCNCTRARRLGQFATSCRPAPPSCALRDELVAFVIIAVWNLRADLVQDHIHIGQCAVVKFIHDANAQMGRQPHHFAIAVRLPALPLFPADWNEDTEIRFASHESKEFDGVGAMHQLASASLAALFSVVLFVTAHLFIDYRSARSPAFTFTERTFVPL